MSWARRIGRIVVVTLRKEGEERLVQLAPRLSEWGVRSRTLVHVTERLLDTREPSLRVRMGELGCAVAHREAVEVAAADGAETVLVLEDDAEAFPGGLEECGRVMDALGERDDWDALNLGGCAADWRPGTPAFGSAGHVPGVTRLVRGMVSTHAVVYHRRVFEKILVGVPARGQAAGYYASMVKPKAYDEWLHMELRVAAPLRPCFFQTGEDSAILANGAHVIDVRQAIEGCGERLRAAEEGG